MQQELINLLKNPEIIKAIAGILNPSIKQLLHALSENPHDAYAKDIFTASLTNDASHTPFAHLTTAEQTLIQEYVTLEGTEFLRNIESFANDETMPLEEQKEFFATALSQLPE